MKKSTLHITLFAILSLLFYSCGKEQYLEKRSGPWKITEVEIAYYSNHSNTADSVINFSADTLGYFNFYHGTPSRVYTVINYPSRFLQKDYSSHYEVHEENHDILVISNLIGSKWVEHRFSVDHPNRTKQKWTIVNDDFAGNAVRETISVHKD